MTGNDWLYILMARSLIATDMATEKMGDIDVRDVFRCCNSHSRPEDCRNCPYDRNNILAAAARSAGL